jgi:hypothetical protein
MGILAEDMKRVVREQRLGYVATVCPDGTPNLSPKGTTAVWDDDHLVFADICSPGRSPTLQTPRDRPQRRRSDRAQGIPVQGNGHRGHGGRAVRSGDGLLPRLARSLGRDRRQGPPHRTREGRAGASAHLPRIRSRDDGREVVKKWSVYYDTLLRSNGDAPKLPQGGSETPGAGRG